MTEQQFFQDIYETTQGCVCDVQFIERYYDTKQDKVSYNYRMVYSSCDRPLTHLQTVEMQNLLRRKLLNCEFHLKQQMVAFYEWEDIFCKGQKISFIYLDIFWSDNPETDRLQTIAASAKALMQLSNHSAAERGQTAVFAE